MLIAGVDVCDVNGDGHGDDNGDNDGDGDGDGDGDNYGNDDGGNGDGDDDVMITITECFLYFWSTALCPVRQFPAHGLLCTNAQVTKH